MARIVKKSEDQHTGDATCLAYHNNYVFSGGADGKIKIWDNDLNLIRTVDAHEAYIYAMAINSLGKLYSSSCDGCVKFVLPPYDNATVQDLFSCDNAIQAMFCTGDILYTGDDKGVVTNWSNDRMLFKYNIVEEIKSMAAEKTLLYTVRDLDIVVSDLLPGKSGRYSNKADFPGKSPLSLIGPIIDEKRSYLICADRSGKGLMCFNNLPNCKFQSIWTLPDCHDMIVNSICGNENFLYSGGYDGMVKGWSNLSSATPNSMGEVEIGSCVNAIVCGSNDFVYIAASDGVIRSAKFI